MPKPTTHLVQIVTYVPPPLKGKVDAARTRASQRAGHPISESAYIKLILERHFERVLTV